MISEDNVIYLTITGHWANDTDQFIDVSGKLRTCWYLRFIDLGYAPVKFDFMLRHNYYEYNYYLRFTRAVDAIDFKLRYYDMVHVPRY